MIALSIASLILGLLIILCARGLSNVARGRKYKSGTIWCAWRWTDVRSEYILRLHVVKTPWFTVCLHWVRKPDPEPWLHDHPVSFLSLVLRGQYAELRKKMGDQNPRLLVHRWFNFIRATPDDRHRIVLTRKDTLTLCFMGPKVREWGFHEVRRPGDWIGWKAYYQYKKDTTELLGDKTAYFNFWKDLDVAVDALAVDFESTYNGKVFIDEDVRMISPVAGDFDDEAPTEPYP